MPNVDEKEMQYSDQDKLTWEVKKLKAEVANLNRPWSRHVTNWATLIAVFASAVGVGVQWYLSQNNYTLSQIKSERTNLDIEEKEKLKRQLGTQIGDIMASMSDLQIQRQQALAATLKLKSDLDELQRKSRRLIAATTQKTDIAEQYNRLLVSTTNIADSLVQLNLASQDQTNSTSAQLTIIADKLAGPTPSTPVSAGSLPQQVHFDPALLQLAISLFDKDDLKARTADHHLANFWAANPDTIPALISVVNTNPENFDGIAKVLEVIRHVERRYFTANRDSIEKLLQRLSISNGARSAKNLQKQIQLINERFLRADLSIGQ